ncbi:MAG: nucleotide exchange factor GrpE [Thermodesulfobacteriota bacterium]
MTDKDMIQTETEPVVTSRSTEPKSDSVTNEAEGRIESKADTVKKEKKKHSVVIEELKSKLEATEQEAKDNYDRFLRNAAELENYKKRTSRQMDEFRKYANESLIMELLTVVDNLERAIQSSRDDENSNAKVVEGVQMTLDEIIKILDKFGVKPIIALEQAFDPTFHQAVMQEESVDFPAQTVVRELQKGYLLHDRLLRPAMVVVSK